ncbi:MAG: type II toxin-antitoxin system VapC family toxin [Isosphaerales bacterium]
MRRVFADTLYWVAITHRKDQWHQAAVKISRTLAGCHLVTSDEVLTEFLAAFCEAGPILRHRAAILVRNLHKKPTVTVHPQSRDTFLTGLTLYEARPDKGYSLTDCISMKTMRQDGITDILTHDNHFTQEGLTILL